MTKDEMDKLRVMLWKKGASPDLVMDVDQFSPELGLPELAARLVEHDRQQRDRRAAAKWQGPPR